MSLPVLVFIHNHRFEDNIARLERVYAPRFSRIHHVMPFYRGSDRNVHRAYEASHQFQGYVAQASDDLSAQEAKHYIFCGDDVILNPRLNETNIISELGLGDGSGYLKSVHSLAQATFSWPHMAGAILAFVQNTGVEWRRELPLYEDARAALERHGIGTQRLSLGNFRDGIGLRQLFQLLFYCLKRIQARSYALTELPYPLAYSYSDFFVVPGNSLASFTHLCGIFAAMNLFSEVAIPTALLMTCEHVVSEGETTLRGQEIWRKNEIEGLHATHNGDLEKLLAAFPAEQLYVHPVKLSQWKV